MVLFVSDPAQPFIVSHNEVRMQPRSYIRLPVRMVPVTAHARFTSTLSVRSADGKHALSLDLRGNTM